MPIDTKITGQRGTDSTLIEAHVHPFDTATGRHAGLITLSHSFVELNPELHPFLNDTFGAAMNQNVTFSGTPEIIHNGGTSTEWTGTAIAGTWNFADSGNITITSANDNDNADFAEENTLTIDMSGFTALTGKVDLDTYSSVNNSMNVQFNLSGTLIGNSVDLNNYIDTGDFAEQNFVVPKTDLGLEAQSLDGMTLTMGRTGGPRPTVKFDDIQFEATGDPAVFKATTPLGTKFHITEIRMRLTDDLDTTLSNASVPNFNPDNILGVTALANGIVFSSVQKGKKPFSVTLKSLDDFLIAGFDLINDPGNATKAGFTLLVKFPEPIILEGDDGKNFISFTINDDLSGLTRFTAAARGAIEV